VLVGVTVWLVAVAVGVAAVKVGVGGFGGDRSTYLCSSGANMVVDDGSSQLEAEDGIAGCSEEGFGVGDGNAGAVQCDVVGLGREVHE
jgi:hypothetical protein